MLRIYIFLFFLLNLCCFLFLAWLLFFFMFLKCVSMLDILVVMENAYRLLNPESQMTMSFSFLIDAYVFSKLTLACLCPYGQITPIANWMEKKKLLVLQHITSAKSVYMARLVA